MGGTRRFVLGGLATLGLAIVPAAGANAALTPAQKQLKKDQVGLANVQNRIAKDEVKFPARDAMEVARFERHLAMANADDAKAAAIDEKVATLQAGPHPDPTKILELSKKASAYAFLAAKLRVVVTHEQAEHEKAAAARAFELAKARAAQAHLEAAILLDEKEIEEGH
jgi:hypothetical protein